MEENVYVVMAKMAASAVIGSMSAVMGGYDAVLRLFLCLVVADFAFGILKSIKEKNFSSSVARWGFVNKLIEFVIIAICVRIDAAIRLDSVLRNIALVWFCICEGSSIIENCAAMGLPLPDGLLSVLVQAKKTVSVNFVDIVKNVFEEHDGKDKK